MEQDKELCQWIMQNCPLDDPAAVYTSTQPTIPSLPQQSSNPQGSITQDPFLAPPQQVFETSHSSHYQYTYEERQYNQHNHFNDETQPEYPHQASQLYPVINGELFPAQRQPQPGHYYPPSNQSHQINGYDSRANMTPRLSDEDEDHCTDAQLKMMTSKERRQLRNKISARNFRNRRKEYIVSLEEEVGKYKNENSQLRLEIKWVRSTMNKLQSDNDHLRVELALCHNGIKTNQDIIPTSSPTLSPSLSAQLSPILATATTDRRKVSSPVSKKNNTNTSAIPTSVFSRDVLDQQNQSGKSLVSAPDLHIVSSPVTTSMAQYTLPSLPILQSELNFTQSTSTWDMATPNDAFIYDQTQQETAPVIIPDTAQDIQQPINSPISQQLPDHQSSLEHNTSNNDRYIATAVFPHFSSGNPLSKQSVSDSSSHQLFVDYPLLVVALVSIIIGHTMSMSTSELLSHTRSLPAKRYDYSNEKDHHHLQQSTRDDLLTKKETQAMWEALIDEMVKLQPDTTAMDHQEQQLIRSATATMDMGNRGIEDPWYDTPVTGLKAICPLYWLQRKLCRFIISYVVVKYPHLEAPCKTYLPICEQFRRRVTQA